MYVWGAPAPPHTPPPLLMRLALVSAQLGSYLLIPAGSARLWLGSVWARAGSDSALLSLAQSHPGYPGEIILMK